MGTRSVIMTYKENGELYGVYHHWDGYPTGVGAALHRLYNEGFGKDFKLMVERVINERVKGWSSITGWDGDPANIADTHKRNYAVPKPESTGLAYFDENGPDEFYKWEDLYSAGIEYVYILTPYQLVVLGHVSNKRVVHLRDEKMETAYELPVIARALWSKPYGVRDDAEPNGYFLPEYIQRKIDDITGLGNL